MSILKPLIILSILVFTSFVNANGEADHESKSVSIIQLISNPEKYDQTKVRLIGVPRLEFEGEFICLNKESYQFWVSKNCLWISPNIKAINIPYKELEKYNGKYVLIEGTFNLKNLGHGGMNSGAIENVTRYQLWE